MEKLRLQLELKLQEKLIKSLKSQGWLATKTSDRFKAGRPDLRVGHGDFGQIDVELKYSLEDWSIDKFEYPTGLSKLQELKIREMNKSGMPAVGLVYSEVLDLFFVTTLLRDTLPPEERRVVKLPGAEVISGPELFVTSMEYLHDIGHNPVHRQYPSPKRGGIR